MTLQAIVTHPGSAHKDDFLACCLLAHLHGVPIERREPNGNDLQNSEFCVVDVGGDHNPSLKNFDHHQFPKDAEPQCALSLVLLDLEIYEDARSFLSWLQPAEWLDTLGPNETATRMGIPRSALSQLNSPIDLTLLARFSRETSIDSTNAIYQVMCMIGEDILHYVRSLRHRLDYLREHCVYSGLICPYCTGHHPKRYVDLQSHVTADHMDKLTGYDVTNTCKVCKVQFHGYAELRDHVQQVKK